MSRRRAHNGPRHRPVLEPMAYRAPRRRRRGRLRGLTVLIALLAALLIAAMVGAAGGDHIGGTGSHARSTGTRAPAGAHHVSNAATLRATRERAEVNRVLRYTPFVSAGIPRRRDIALTFDDGPSPYTPKIIRILLRMHVPATFFIVGQQLNDFSSGLREEVQHGFTIGDHTENHAWLTRLSAAAEYGQIHDAAVRAQRLGAPFPILFRPPYGVFNGRTLAILRRLRMLMVMWSIETGDWRRPGTAAIVSRALSGARAGAIVLMHDGGGDRSQTVAALPAIINGLRKRHYHLVSVPTLVAVDPPPHRQRVPQLVGG